MLSEVYDTSFAVVHLSTQQKNAGATATNTAVKHTYICEAQRKEAESTCHVLFQNNHVLQPAYRHIPRLSVNKYAYRNEGVQDRCGLTMLAANDSSTAESQRVRVVMRSYFQLHCSFLRGSYSETSLWQCPLIH